MSATEGSVVSNYSYPESMEPDIVDEIVSEFAKLRALLSKVATVQRALDALFIKQKEEAYEAVQKAQKHPALVTGEQVKMREMLRQEYMAANEIFAGNKSDSCVGTDTTVIKLKEEEADREAAQEAAMIAAVEEHHKAEVEQKHLEEERLAKEGREAAQKARISVMQEVTMVAAGAAGQACKEIERQKKEKVEEARILAEKLNYEIDIIAKLVRLEADQLDEEDSVWLEEEERCEMEFEAVHLAQWKIEEEMKAQQRAEQEQCRLAEEEEDIQAARLNRKNKHRLRRQKEQKERLERENKQREEQERPADRDPIANITDDSVLEAVDNWGFTFRSKRNWRRVPNTNSV